MFLDLGRLIGDPEPGTEDLWWRHVPLLMPTLVTVTAAFFISRALIRDRSGNGD